MPAPSGQLRPGRYIGGLGALLALLYVLVFFTGSGPTPKLGLDLKGGTTVTLTAKTQGGQAPTPDALNQARQIIERRVNGLGVAEAEVVTEGRTNIVISVPGTRGEQAKSLAQTAQLRFRPVIASATAAPAAAPSPTPTPSRSPGSSPSRSASPTPSGRSSASGSASATSAPTSAGSPTSTSTASAHGRPLPPFAAGPTPTAGGSSAAASRGATPSRPAIATSAAPTATAPATAAAGIPATPPPGVSQSAYQQAVLAFERLTCSSAQQTGGSNDDARAVTASCAQDGLAKYLLAPTIIEGTEISGAQASTDSQGLGAWTVLLNLKSSGQTTWANYTSRHNVTVSPNDPGNAVAFVLDGRVVSAPAIQSTINGQTQITGNFSQQSATDLANTLRYGALPLTFTQSNALTVSPTLGTDQLRAGLLAGGIGLVLVVAYTFLYYRALGLVTIASLALSGLLVYACLVILGRQINFTLSLAGIAGFIVAIGITADSFVVFFERLKDEVREGRSMRSGVPRAWVRARRTIISADAVSLLAAVVLYYLAVGPVKGFAFTLGMSTILDLLIVFTFTHPVVAIASRNRFFSSPRYSGLAAVQRSVAEHAAAASAASSATARAAARRSRVAKES